MHFALYTPGWPVEDFQNGIVTYVRHMRQGLIRLGHRVTLVAGKIGPSNQDQDVLEVKANPFTEVLYRAKRRAGLLTVFDFSGPIADTFARIHKSDPIDLIEMEESFGWVSGLRNIGVPIVVRLHGPAFLSLVGEDRETPSALRKIAREGRALAHAKFMTAPSLSTASDTQAKYGLLGKMTHARNPIEPTTMTRWNAESADRDTALFVGRFDARKGGDIALLAFKRVLARKPSARLVFVGPDVGFRRSDGTVDHFEEFAAGVFSPAERSRIMYEGSQVPSTIEALRTKARVTIVASRWESAGYTAAEALAQGCPVVAMDCPGVDEVVRTDQTGMLSANVEEFSDHILELLENPAKGAQLGANGRQYITDTHSPEVAVRVALKVYEEAIGRSGHG